MAGRSQFKLDEIDIPALSPLQTPPDAFCDTFPGVVRSRAVKRLDPFLRLAERTLTEIREADAYGVGASARQGRRRGYDYYASDTARIFALATSFNRYALNHGRIPDFMNPSTVTEKLLVMKMFGEIPDGPPADKLLSEHFVPQETLGLLTPFRRQWMSKNPELPENALIPPGRYFLKTNFGAGNNIPVTFPLDDDTRAELLKKIAYWFERRHLHGFWAGEWWYHTISPRIFLEDNLAPDGGDIADWKFWVTGGKLQIVQVDHDRSSNHVQKIYDREFRLTQHELYYQTSDKADRVPQRFGDMVRIVESAARDLEFARVDLYYLDERIYLGEITLCPFGAKKRIRSAQLDRDMGQGWQGTRLFPATG